MTDRATVAERLECYRLKDQEWREHCTNTTCPYNNNDPHYGYWCCSNRLLHDAVTLLKAQEPRVMTLDEIGNALKTPIWKETKSAHKDLYTGWVLAYDIQTGQGITGTRLGMSEPNGRVVWYRLEGYGKTWRCWTDKPTDEQRKAVKWDA